MISDTARKGKRTPVRGALIGVLLLTGAVLCRAQDVAPAAKPADPAAKTALAAKELAVGSQIQVRAWIRLGAIPSEEVAVELYLGRLDSGGEITDGVAISMQPAGQSPDGLSIFEAAAVPCNRSGLHGYTVRVLPFHADEAKAFLPGIITWAEAQ